MHNETFMNWCMSDVRHPHPAQRQLDDMWSVAGNDPAGGQKHDSDTTALFPKIKLLPFNTRGEQTDVLLTTAVGDGPEGPACPSVSWFLNTNPGKIPCWRAAKLQPLQHKDNRGYSFNIPCPSSPFLPILVPESSPEWTWHCPTLSAVSHNSSSVVEPHSHHR